MMMPNNRPFEEARILETARQLDERDPDRIKMRMQEKFLAIAVGNEQSEKQWFVLKTAHKQEKAVNQIVPAIVVETTVDLKHNASNTLSSLLAEIGTDLGEATGRPATASPPVRRYERKSKN